MSRYTHEKQIQKFINDFRKQNGVSPVEYHDKVYFYAKRHNHEMSSRGEVFISEYDKLKCGELYYYHEGSVSPREVVDFWIRHDICKYWLLNDKVEYGAVHVLKDYDKVWVTWSIWNGMSIKVHEVVKKKTWKDKWFVKFTLKPILWAFIKILLIFLYIPIHIMYKMALPSKNPYWFNALDRNLYYKIRGYGFTYKDILNYRKENKGKRSHNSLEYYYCTKCKRDHQVYSRIGRDHQKYAGL